MAASRKIRNDQAKSLFQRRNLKRPVGSGASKSVDEHQRFAMASNQIVQRFFLVGKKDVGDH